MSTHEGRRGAILPTLLLAIAVHITPMTPLIPSVRAHAIAPSSEDMMIQADEERAAHHYDKSALLYGDAYRARPEQKRADGTGENLVRSAMEDFDLALKERSDDLELLGAQEQLLDEFLSARKMGGETEVPPDLLDKLLQTRQHIANIEQSFKPRPVDQPQPAPEESQPPQEQPQSQPEPHLESTPAPRKGGPAILAVGALSVVGGGALIASGAWNFIETNKLTNSQLDALDAEPLYTDEQRQAYRESLDDWRQDWRTVSTALVASGVTLATVGIVLTSWGSVRMRRNRSSSHGSRAALAPAVGPGHVGGYLSVEF